MGDQPHGTTGYQSIFAAGLALFGAQIAFSRIWLNRHRFGPAEWIWRSLTYGARQLF